MFLGINFIFFKKGKCSIFKEVLYSTPTLKNMFYNLSNDLKF